MSLRSIITLAAIAVMAATPIRAGSQPLSGISAAFVDVSLPARPAGMGGAAVALADGADALTMNPGGAAFGEGLEAGFRYADAYSLFGESQAVVALRPGRSGLAFALRSSGDESLRETTASATIGLRMGRLGVGATFKARQATFGRNTLDPGDLVVFDPDEIAGGIANQVKGDAQGAGLDLGLQIDLGRGMRLGALVRDLVAPVWWSSSRASSLVTKSYVEYVPREFVAGLSARVSRYGLFAADLRPGWARDQQSIVRVGTEWTLLDLLFLRGGVERFVVERRLNAWSLGFGLAVPRMLGLNLVVDYAYRSQVIGRTQAVSLVVRMP